MQKTVVNYPNVSEQRASSHHGRKNSTIRPEYYFFKNITLINLKKENILHFEHTQKNYLINKTITEQKQEI